MEVALVPMLQIITMKKTIELHVRFIQDKILQF